MTDSEDPGASGEILIIIAGCVKQAWEDDYPPELKPWMVKGRKMWRKKHLIELILCKIGPQYIAVVKSFVAACGDLE